MNKYVNKGKVLQNDEFYEQNHISYLITKEKKLENFKSKGSEEGNINLLHTITTYITFYLCQRAYKYLH